MMSRVALACTRDKLPVLLTLLAKQSDSVLSSSSTPMLFSGLHPTTGGLFAPRPKQHRCAFHSSAPSRYRPSLATAAGEEQQASEAPQPSSTSNPVELPSSSKAGGSASSSSSSSGTAVTKGSFSSSVSGGSIAGGSRSSSGRPRAAAKTGLQAIKGVGPHYESLLRLQGVTSVETLQERLHLAYEGDADLLQRFLQEEVGIKNRNHAAWVAQHVRDLAWAPPRPRVTLAVEGNIGAGKSTFLNMLSDPGIMGSLLSERMEVQDVVGVQVVQEPVDEWQSVKAKDRNGREREYNVLEQFYKDPKRYGLSFQQFVLLSRIRKERGTRAGSSPLRVLERSIFSDRMVFVRAMHEAGTMEDWELELYDSWFKQELSLDPYMPPSGFIYLQAEPDTCMRRMRHRARNEEEKVPQSYLETLHSNHEDWLNVDVSEEEDGLVRTTTGLQLGSQPLSEDQRRSSRVLSAAGHSGRLRLYHPTDDRSRQLPDGLQQLLRREAQPASIRDKVVFLAGDGHSAVGQPVHEILNGTPALILDHNHDSLHDLDAQREQAKQVADFFSYVQRVQQQLGLEAHRPKGLQPRGAAAAGGMDMGAGGLPGMSNWAAEDAAIANLLEARWDLTRKNFLSRADAQREAQMQMIREMDALVKGLSTGRQAALAGFQG